MIWVAAGRDAQPRGPASLGQRVGPGPSGTAAGAGRSLSTWLHRVVTDRSPGVLRSRRPVPVERIEAPRCAARSPGCPPSSGSAPCCGSWTARPTRRSPPSPGRARTRCGAGSTARGPGWRRCCAPGGQPGPRTISGCRGSGAAMLPAAGVVQTLRRWSPSSRPKHWRSVGAACESVGCATAPTDACLRATAVPAADSPPRRPVAAPPGHPPPPPDRCTTEPPERARTGLRAVVVTYAPPTTTSSRCQRRGAPRRQEAPVGCHPCQRALRT